jgi:hypothetical protein
VGWLLAVEAVTVVVAGNYLWVQAVRHLDSAYQARALRIWFFGPMFADREQFTEAGWRYRALARTTGWIGVTAFLLTALVSLR